MGCSQHEEFDEGCSTCQFKAKLRSLQFGNVMAPPERIHEQRLDRDLPAYYQLRRQGLQPKSTRNAYELSQRSNDQLEIELGKLIEPKLLKTHRGEINDGMAMARDAGYTTEDVVGWKKARDAKT